MFCIWAITSTIVDIVLFGFTTTGAIELSILSEYYSREIAAYDIQTMRCDLYGQVFLFLSLF